MSTNSEQGSSQSSFLGTSRRVGIGCRERMEFDTYWSLSKMIYLLEVDGEEEDCGALSVVVVVFPCKKGRRKEELEAVCWDDKETRCFDTRLQTTLVPRSCASQIHLV